MDDTVDDTADDGLGAARTLLPDERLEHVETLGSGRRSSVIRASALDSHGGRRSLIVKQFHAAGEGWVREVAALTTIAAAGAVPRVPRLVAVGEPTVLITEDLGTGASLADVLLSDDPRAATQALIGWAEAIADLHVTTRDSRDAFTAALAAREGDLAVAVAPLGRTLEDAVRVLDREAGALEVPVASGTFEQLLGLAKRLGPEGVSALTPADACPDNNVATASGLALTDFEGAQWRHVAWDVAYLCVPWPSCWCSWQIPEPVVAAAVAAYRERAAAIGGVGDPQFERDLEAATVGWALISVSWFIENALAGDPDLNPAHPTPTRRAMIMQRLALAAASSELPKLATLAAHVHEALARRWGEVSLEPAPAYRNDRQRRDQ